MIFKELGVGIHNTIVHAHRSVHEIDKLPLGSASCKIELKASIHACKTVNDRILNKIMIIKWKNEKIVAMQAGSLLLRRRNEKRCSRQVKRYIFKNIN